MKRKSLLLSGGFTLLELLVVIAIIVALAGLVIALKGPVDQQVARSRTETLIAALKASLEQYRVEYGVYPECSDSLKGGKVLYEHLYGDLDNNGEPDSFGVDGDATVKTFFAKLRPPTGSEVNPYLTNQADHWEVVDAWGDPIRYLSYPPGHSSYPNGGAEHNPGYDIWSIANDPIPDDEDRAMWIKNW